MSVALDQTPVRGPQDFSNVALLTLGTGKVFAGRGRGPHGIAYVT